jgi:hypothetical protein
VTRNPLVYLAHPIATYGTEWSVRCLDAVARHWPNAEVVDPAVRFASNAEWLADWPVIAPTLRALVVVGDESGTVGAGCLRELVDAIFWGVGVFTLVERRGVLRLARLSGLDVPQGANARAAAVLRPGRGISPAARSGGRR